MSDIKVIKDEDLIEQYELNSSEQKQFNDEDYMRIKK